MQIARRLRAMIVNLADTLPAQRHPALHQELNLLDRMIGKLYATLTGFEPVLVGVSDCAKTELKRLD